MGIKLKGPAPGRNELCPCNSGLKFKFCHGDPSKAAVCDRIVSEHMSKLIAKEQHKRGILSDDEYKMFKERYDPEVSPEPVTGQDVNEILNNAGLKRCTCGIPIPDDCKLCIKCKRKG